MVCHSKFYFFKECSKRFCNKIPKLEEILQKIRIFGMLKPDKFSFSTDFLIRGQVERLTFADSDSVFLMNYNGSEKFLLKIVIY